MNYKQNTVILIPFPFTDLSSSKRRPALILCDQKDQDIICVPISSQVGTTADDLEIAEKFCENFTFPITSYLRVNKIYTLHSNLVVKVLGKLEEKFFQKAKRLVLNKLEE